MEVFKNIANQFENASFNWISHVVFGSFLVIGLLIGLGLGRRSAIYFGATALVGFALPIIIVSIGVSFSLDLIIQKSWKINGISLQTLISNNQADLAALMALPIFIGSILVVFLISLVPYYIFRKKYFKKIIFEFKKEGKKTKAIRWQGGIISLIFVFPIATFLAAYAASLGHDNSYSSFYSKVTNILTFGQVKDVANNVRGTLKDAWALISISENKDTKDLISGLAGDKLANPAAIHDILKDPTAHKALETIFNSNLLSKNVDIIFNRLTPQQISNIDFSDPGRLGLKSGEGISVSKNALDNFAKALSDHLKSAGAKVSTNALVDFLKNSNLVSLI